MPGRDPDHSAATPADRADAQNATTDADEGDGELTAAGRRESAEPAEPVMPSPPFPTFTSRPTLPHQPPGVGFESGRDSRAR